VERGALFAVITAALCAGCEAPADPPAPRARASTGHDAGASLEAPEPIDGAILDGAIDDALDGAVSEGGSAPPDPEAIGQEQVLSTALESSIYEEPRWGSRRLGYLRAGGIIHRAAVPRATSEACPGGWYRVEPRGFLCVGPMASLDLAHPVALAAARRPREDDLPYFYVLSRSPPPPLYARLPSRRDQRRFEPDLAEHLLSGQLGPALPQAEPLPDFLAPGRPMPALAGAVPPAERVLLGRARSRSGFALLSTFDHEGRRFGLTTGLALIPLDRTRAVASSAFHGVELGQGVSLPLAFVRRPGAFRLLDEPTGLRGGGALAFREAVPVSEERRTREGIEYLVARDGSLVAANRCVIVKALRHPPAWAEEGVKWIEVSIPRQSLVAYEGTTPVYATLVSTGVGGTADPHETHATVQGTFKIYEKHLSVTMAGREASDPFDLRDVPFVQYFHEGYALHGAYWHDDFGRTHSHGCVNLAPRDAAWLFKWTDPHVPAGWHGVMTKEGTLVYVHG
jgi:hypothetical protein